MTISFKALQFLNNLSIEVTDEVSKLSIFNDVNLVHPKNISFMFLTLVVMKLFISKDSNDLQL